MNCRSPELHPAEALGQVVIDLVVAEVLAEGAEVGVCVYHRDFYTEHFGEVFHVLRLDGLAEGRVVGAAGVDSGCAAGLEVRPGFPDCAGHGQLGQLLGRDDDIHLVHDQAEAVAQVNHRGVDGFAGRDVED